MKALSLAVVLATGLATWTASAAAQQTIPCSGPSAIPSGGMQGPYCHNGRMGFAATEFAPLSQASSMPRMRAVMFARREAEMRARSSMARFLSDMSITETSISSDASLESSERDAWMNFISTTSVQTVRAKLLAGVAVIATDEQEDVIFITVATTPDMKDLAGSVNNYRPSGVNQSTSPKASANSSSIDPFSVVPKNVAPW